VVELNGLLYSSTTFTCYDGNVWVKWSPQLEFAYNPNRPLGIEHTLFEANYGFSHEEPPELLLLVRPSIPVSTVGHNER
jgi:hypothetical protein